MKKINLFLTIICTLFIMCALSSLAASPNTMETAEVLPLDEQLSVTVSPNNTDDYYGKKINYYLQIIPQETALYEFEVDCQEPAMFEIFDGYYYKCIEDFSDYINIQELTAGKIYYIRCSTYYSPITFNIVFRRHEHSNSFNLYYGATLEYDGRMEVKCTKCGKTSDVTIPKIESVSVSQKTFTYSGKACSPKLVIKDAKEKNSSKRHRL